jgi:hypothetical protein
MLGTTTPSKSAESAIVSGGIAFAAVLISVDWAVAVPPEHTPMQSNRMKRRDATTNPDPAAGSSG